MKKIFIMMVAGLMAIATMAEEKIVCEGEYKGHLQGVATDGESIYWSFTVKLVKTDMKGRVLAALEVPRHYGDLCVKDGVVYVAVNLGKFNTEKGGVSEVRAHSAKDLSEKGRWELPMCVHGAGGITCAGDRFFVVGGLPPTHKRNYVYEFTSDFKLVKRHVLETGYTRLGIQTAAFEDGRFLFGIYGTKDNPEGVLECPRDLSTYVRYLGSGCLGIMKMGGEYWLGQGTPGNTKLKKGWLVKRPDYPDSEPIYKPIDTIGNESLRIEFDSAENGFGVKSIVNLQAGGVRFVNPDGVAKDRWRVEQYRHCPNFCWVCPDAGKTLADFWELELREAGALGDRGKAIFIDNRSECRAREVRHEEGGATFVWTGVKLPEGEADVCARVRFAEDGTSRWTIKADVRSARYCLLNTNYPLLRHVVKAGEADFLEPREDFGAKLRRKAGYDKAARAHGVLAYVPMMTAFMIGEAGFYIAAHDERVNTKTLVISGDRDVAFSSPGPRGDYEVTIAAFKGDWWEAARIYKRWAMTAPWCKKGRILDRKDYSRRLCETPLWFNFHGNAIAASNALTRAKELFPGVTTGLHWHRWQAVPWEIGHYPEYFPEDDGVKDCLKYLKSINQEALLYALPRLYSKSLLSFHFAEPYTIKDESGKYCVEQYGRLEDSPPELVQMCPGVGKWQECVVDYTTRMFELGATSVFQDQVSSCPSKACYGVGHDHQPGGGTWFYDSVKAICARTHELARERGGYTADEGSVDAFNDVIDGHLTITQRKTDDVPFWHAVYNGYTTYFGSPENHDDDEDTFWAMQMRDALWGQELGWYHTLLMENEGKVAMVRRLIEFRQANLDCLAYGELLGEVAFAGEVPVRKLKMLGRKSFPDWANPNAKLSPTIEGEMPGVLGYLYKSGVTGEECAIVANLMPVEVSVELSQRGMDGKMVLLPREIRRVKLNP